MSPNAAWKPASNGCPTRPARVMFGILYPTEERSASSITAVAVIPPKVGIHVGVIPPKVGIHVGVIPPKVGIHVGVTPRMGVIYLGVIPRRGGTHAVGTSACFAITSFGQRQDETQGPPRA